MAKLSASVGMPVPATPADFGGAIKGKKSVQSMRDAVDQVLADAKMAASDLAHRMAQNLRTLEEQAEFAHLFADRASLVLKMPEDLQAVVANRVAEHKRKEAERLEAERERIRAEEAARLQREAEARAAQERAAQEAAAQAAAAEAAKAITQAAAPAPAAAPAEQPSRLNPEAAWPFPKRDAPAPVAEEKPTLKLGDLCTRLGFTVTAEFLAELGFPAHVERSSKLYRPSQFPAICDAIRAHITGVREQYAYQPLTAAA